MNSSNDNSNGSHGRDRDTLRDDRVWAVPTGARLTRELTAELDAAVDNIDDSTARRLAGVRREALAQVSGKPSIGLLGAPWATATAGLAALLVVVLLGFESLEKNADLAVINNSPTTMESLPVLSSSEDLEFIQSVEFLVWMEKNSG